MRARLEPTRTGPFQPNKYTGAPTRTHEELRQSQVEDAKVGAGKLASRLLADGEVAATLTWARSWGSLATGKSGGSEWTFKRLGFLRPRVTVRGTGSDSNLAVLSINWAGEGAGGVFRWRDVSV